LKDNYAYLIEDRAAGLCAVVDPSEAAPVRKALGGRRLTHILNTHHHWDHTGGNPALKEDSGATIVGPGKDRDRIPGIDVGVDESAPWQFGPHTVTVLEIPAHTRGHIAFVFDGHEMAFTGDTLFAMGCGRLFEGDAATMWASLSKLKKLPDATAIYCGHEYTLSNGRFAMTLEPGNAALGARMRDVEALRAKNETTIPTTIGLEKKTNPFLRPDSREIRTTLGW
jgi:hydroxyacylglutathione hydrolase